MARLTVPQLDSLRDNIDNDGLHLDEEEAKLILAAATLYVRNQPRARVVSEIRKENPGMSLTECLDLANIEVGRITP